MKTKEPLRVLIVDDEAVARRRLVRMVSELPNRDVAGTAADGEEAIQAFETADFDVALLDIRMPRRDGLAVARTLPETAAVIFTTAYAEHAVEAFEAEAIDYLLKPIDRHRLRCALDKVEARRRNAKLSQVLDRLEQRLRPSDEIPRLAARIGRSTYYLDPREVTCFRARDKYVEARLGERKLLLEYSLDDLEDRLRHFDFVRCHRSELVRLDAIRALHEEEGSILEMTDGQRIPVSRRRIAEVRRYLQPGDASA